MQGEPTCKRSAIDFGIAAIFRIFAGIPPAFCSPCRAGQRRNTTGLDAGSGCRLRRGRRRRRLNRNGCFAVLLQSDHETRHKKHLYAEPGVSKSSSRTAPSVRSCLRLVPCSRIFQHRRIVEVRPIRPTLRSAMRTGAMDCLPHQAKLMVRRLILPVRVTTRPGTCHDHNRRDPDTRPSPHRHHPVPAVEEPFTWS